MKTHVKVVKKSTVHNSYTYRVNIVHRITQVRLQFSDSALQFILLVQQSMDVIDSYSNKSIPISSFAKGCLWHMHDTKKIRET